MVQLVVIAAVSVKGFCAGGGNIQSIVPDDGMTDGPDVLFTSSDDGEVAVIL